MQPAAKRLSLRSEIVLYLGALTLLSCTLLSYLGLKVTKINLIDIEKGAVLNRLNNLKPQLVLGYTAQSPFESVKPLYLAGFQRYALWDEELNLLLSNDAPSGTAEIPVMAPAFAAQLRDTGDLIVEERGRLAAYTPVFDGERFWGILRVELDLSEINKAIRQARLPVLLGALLYSLLLASFAYLALSKLIIKPMELMVNVAGRIAGGDVARRIPVERNNELGDLAKALNGMTDKLVHHQAELVQREKLATVGRLVSGITHEIGNPLGTVIGYLEMLKEPKLADEHPELLRRIENEMTRIHSLTRQLLGYVRPGEQQPQQVRLAELVRSTLEESLDPKLRAEVDIEYQLDSAVVCKLDPAAFRQVLVNLAMNACHAMRARSGRGKLKLSLSTESSGVLLQITDTGSGIAPEHLGKIFEPFFTTKKAGEGSGLGLFISQQIVRNAGGELSVESELNRGTTFSISLPKA